MHRNPNPAPQSERTTATVTALHSRRVTVPPGRPPSPEDLTDAELLQRCRARDSASWRVLVSRYERLVYSVALRNGLTAEDAADVTQTTFVALIDALHRLRDEERLASWLMTVARRQSWRIRNDRRRGVSLDDIPEQAEDPLADWATMTVLHEGLAQLGGICRDLLQALYFDPNEPSYAEIADRFGRSIGGIGPLRGRCLQKLRSIIEDERALA